MPAVPTTTPAQRQARADALRRCEALAQHRQQVQAAQHHRAGACTAGGWAVANDQVDADFDLDPSLIAELLRTGPGLPLIEPLSRGPVMRAAPPPRRPVPAGPSFSDWLDEYLSPPPSTAAPGTAARFADEVPGVLSGPGNVLGNFSGALAGAWQGAGEGGRAQCAGRGHAGHPGGADPEAGAGPEPHALQRGAARPAAPRAAARTRPAGEAPASDGAHAWRPGHPVAR